MIDYRESLCSRVMRNLQKNNNKLSNGKNPLKQIQPWTWEASMGVRRIDLLHKENKTTCSEDSWWLASQSHERHCEASPIFSLLKCPLVQRGERWCWLDKRLLVRINPCLNLVDFGRIPLLLGLYCNKLDCCLILRKWILKSNQASSFSL